MDFGDRKPIYLFNSFTVCFARLFAQFIYGVKLKHYHEITFYLQLTTRVWEGVVAHACLEVPKYLARRTSLLLQFHHIPIRLISGS